MVILLLLVTAALGAGWSVEQRVAEGPVLLPSGVALRLTSIDHDLPILRDLGGAPLEVRAVEGELLVAAALSQRTLWIAAPGAMLRTSGSSWSAADWASLERQAMSGNVDFGTFEALDAEVGASLSVRQRSIEDREVIRLGVLKDLEAVRPLGGFTHLSTPEIPLEPGEVLEVTGPGTALLRSVPATSAGRLVRYELCVELDGEPQGCDRFASTGEVPRPWRLFIPPGAHHLAVTSDSQVSLSVEYHRSKPRAGRRWTRLTPEHPAARAEALYLSGQSRQAADAFRPLLGDPLVGELALIRLVQTTPDDSELQQLASQIPASEDARVLFLAALIRRRPQLDDSLVYDAALATSHTVDGFSSWLDDVSGARPRGLEARSRAAMPWPATPEAARSEARTSSMSTRFTLLEADGPPISTFRAPRGPGVPVVKLQAPATVELEVPRATNGRVPVGRFDAGGHARFTLSGETYVGSGLLEIAVEPGPHSLILSEGSLDVRPTEWLAAADHEVLQPLYALPATFSLPDPGVPAELRILTDTPGTLWLGFDDGSTQKLVASMEPVGVRTGAWAEAVTVQGQGAVNVQLRTSLQDANAANEEGVAPDPREALERLQELSVAISAGENALRPERAAWLARLGQRSRAHQDLRHYVELGGSAEVASQTEERFGPGSPTAGFAGPLNRAAALAKLAGETEDKTAQPAPSESAARKALLACDAEDLLAAGEPVRALTLALAAGEAGEDVTTRILAGMNPVPLPYSEGGAGLETVHWAPPPSERDSVADQVPWVLLSSPWPEKDTLVLRHGRTNIVRMHTRAELSLICRVESGPRGPCTSDLLTSRGPEPISLPADASTTLRLPAGELELRGPEPGRAWLIRLSVDGRAIPPGGDRRALKVTPQRPSSLIVAGNAALRVDVVTGRSVTVSSGELEASAAAGEQAWLPLPEAGPRRVEIRGQGSVLLYRATYEPSAVPPELEVAPAPSRTELRLFALRATGPRATLRTPGSFGTVRLRSTVRRDRLFSPTEPWESAELAAAWAKRDGGHWWWLEAWTRGGQLAAGAVAERGWVWQSGWIAAAVNSGVARGRTGEAWAADLRLRGRNDVNLAPALRLRVHGALRGTVASPPTPTPVDPRVWTAYRQAHPVSLAAGAQLIHTRLRDLRLSIGLSTLSDVNTPLRRVSGEVEADWLLSQRTVLGADVALHQRLADDVAFSPLLAAHLSLAHAVWLRTSHRLGFFARVGVTDAPFPIGSIGIEALFHHNRGSRDLPPDHESFRSLRGIRWH